MKLRHKFITFEGIEGCGKSTQIKLLKKYLEENNYEVVLTREPGGCAIADQIRAILLDANNKSMSKLTELFLYEASRNQHVQDIIKPNLKNGKIVLCDRFFDSTTAYQGAARAIPDKIILQLNKLATDGLVPDLTLILDCPVALGLSRARLRNKNQNSQEERFEKEKTAFHEKVRKGYLRLARLHKRRIKVIPATGSINEIHQRIIKLVCHSKR